MLIQSNLVVIFILNTQAFIKLFLDVYIYLCLYSILIDFIDLDNKFIRIKIFTHSKIQYPVWYTDSRNILLRMTC